MGLWAMPPWIKRPRVSGGGGDGSGGDGSRGGDGGGAFSAYVAPVFPNGADGHHHYHASLADSAVASDGIEVSVATDVHSRARFLLVPRGLVRINLCLRRHM